MRKRGASITLINALMMAAVLASGCQPRSTAGLTPLPTTGGRPAAPNAGGNTGGVDGGTPTKVPPQNTGDLPSDPGTLPANPAPLDPNAPVGGGSSGGTTIGALALFGTVAGPAQIISNNGSAIISNNGSAIISNNGSAIISNNGSAIISNNGSAIISNNGSAYQVLAAAPDERFLTNAFMYLTDRDEKFFRNTQTNRAFTATTNATGAFSFDAKTDNGFPFNKDVVVNAMINGNLRMTGYMTPFEGKNEIKLNLGTTLATELLRGEAYRKGKSLSAFSQTAYQSLATDTQAAIVSGDISAVETKNVAADGAIAGEAVTVGVFDLRFDHVHDLRNQYVKALSAVDFGNTVVKSLSEKWKALLGYRPVAITSLIGNGQLPKVTPRPEEFNVEGDERNGYPHTDDPTKLPAGFVYGVAVGKAGDIFYSAYTFDANSGHIRWMKPNGDGTYKVTTLTTTPIARMGLAAPQGICIEKDPADPARTVGFGDNAVLVPEGMGTILVTDATLNRVYRFYTQETSVSADYESRILAGNAERVIGFGTKPDDPDQYDYPYYSAADFPDDVPDGNPYAAVDGQTPLTSRYRLSEEGERPIYSDYYGGTPIPNPARFATLNQPLDVKTDEYGNIYIADYGNHRIRMIPSEAGVAAMPQMFGYQEPIDLKDPRDFDNDGNLDEPDGLIDLDGANQPMFDATKTTLKAGHIYTIAGNPDWEDADETLTVDDGVGRWFGEFDNSDGRRGQLAKLDQPTGLAWHNGYLYIADFDNQRVRRLNRQTGLIETVAGSPSGAQRNTSAGDWDYTPGVGGDGGAAKAAQLAFPTALTFDQKDRLYISDVKSGRIRMVDMATGIISTVAGRVRPPETAASTDNFTDGDALNWCDLFDTQFLAADPDGNIIFADGRHYRIRKLWRQWD